MTKHPAVGKRAYYTVAPNPKDSDNAMRVLVRILSVRPAFGREDAVVVPIKGDGELRVSLESLEVAE